MFNYYQELAKMRKSFNKTQKQMSFKYNLSISSISAIENGRMFNDNVLIGYLKDFCPCVSFMEKVVEDYANTVADRLFEQGQMHDEYAKLKISFIITCYFNA